LKPLNESSNVEKISFANHLLLKNLCGEHDKHLKLIEHLEPVKVKAWGNNITVSGENRGVHKISILLQQLYAMMEKGWHLQSPDIDYAHRILSEDIHFELANIFLDTVLIASPKRVITPKSIAQRLYIDYMRHHDMVFAIGPAGTGKTYLAMAMAVSSLLERRIQRII